MRNVLLLPAEGLLRNPAFDTIFIVGFTVVAVTAGLMVTVESSLFVPILLFDLWFLGYHHVVSTYTRLTFDLDSFRKNQDLVLYLPIAVAVVVTLVAVQWGAWLITTIYFHWQWYHYTRQSEGISKAYAAKSKTKNLGNPSIARLAFYAVPLAALFNASYRSPELFLSMPFATLPITAEALTIVNVLAASAFLSWCAEQFKAAKAGKLALPYVLYMLSHFVIYCTAYIWIEKIDYGWLIINIWHNAYCSYSGHADAYDHCFSVQLHD